jgi:cellulose synthase/poly-beta-1,6-N-acetylglucosamine synthase-like glycosyltransferase
MTGSAILFAMKVSVIIPAYNEEKYITKALTAVSNLKTKPFEVIVVDNGSTDKTVELVKKFPNVRLISFTKIKGPNAARQAGFLASKGEKAAKGTKVRTPLPFLPLCTLSPVKPLSPSSKKPWSGSQFVL